jgi:hypothetical protein
VASPVVQHRATSAGQAGAAAGILIITAVDVGSTPARSVRCTVRAAPTSVFSVRVGNWSRERAGHFGLVSNCTLTPSVKRSATGHPLGTFDVLRAVTSTTNGARFRRAWSLLDESLARAQERGRDRRRFFVRSILSTDGSVPIDTIDPSIPSSRPTPFQVVQPLVQPPAPVPPRAAAAAHLRVQHRPLRSRTSDGIGKRNEGACRRCVRACETNIHGPIRR